MELALSRFPDFYVVGSAKSGTTAIWNYFKEHPDIFVTNKIQHKELGYFSNHYGIEDKKSYQSYFDDADTQQLIGEVCHAYMTSPESADLIFQECPNAKIIMVLRNPINRAYSLYNWMVMEGYESCRTFELALKKEEIRFNDDSFVKNNPHGFYQNYMYASSGLYYEQILRYMNKFKREHVLIVLYEDFVKNHNAVLSNIYNFLGVRKNEHEKGKKVNVSTSIRHPASYFFAKRKLQNQFSNRPLLGKFINKVSSVVVSWNRMESKPPKMSEKTYKRLESYYFEDVKKTSELIERNLLELWGY